MLQYGQKSFLIVDDFTDFRTSTRSMLRELGVRDVDTADSGEQAIRMCGQKRYDFILQDFHLGDGKKNGQQVLEDLILDKLISHECVFIMVTAESSQAIVLSAIEHEPDAYLTKPFNRVGLAQRLEKLVQRKTLLKPILQALDRGRPAEVLAACAELCKQDPRFAPLCLRYRADALRDLGRFDELDKFLKAILASRPQPWAYSALGSLLHKRGQHAQAQGVYEQALKAFPIMPALYDGMAEVLVAQGETKRAQHMLEEAVRLSPLAVRRQAALGKLALSNEDFESASKAYRHAVNQGQSSRYKDAESNLGLVQALMNKNAGFGLDARTRVEINTVLSEVAKENVEDQGLQVRARLMKAASLQQAGDAETAAKLTEQAMQRLDKMEQFFSVEAALTVAKQLQALGQEAAGGAILKGCVETYGDDPKVMQSVAKLTDDPAVLGAVTEAVDLNRQGVRSYQGGQLNEALEMFRKALGLQPKNISIALNTAQALLRIGGETPSPDIMQECRSCLNSVAGIPASDSRYDRYRKLHVRIFGA
ncbi:response regulator [Pseudomonas sp. SWI6]|uniref:Tetratricopeptide repeat protein n=1 Tax=Pseudomonas taiwanensis TaxID=470150 RepID=A0ABR6V7D1_9PSED|nr:MULTISPECIES: tetratricopeptide repeat-containing response regulator [Pseudomonas]AGZ37029.1 response regulator/TPR domain-containing protein [Pseudomonas sp. VLB120]AVD81639.1 response regulator [Pseudomonas sp. SWI6]AVD88608.1 response regulator [Pseudomonas sp. SWI44]MBC3476449.1 tetratricopeptide repeat protein [Pseudomonas taiwanensis]MBC3490808.1 tetratricopeptide repeat protein [Pseudomonas taiwanensis]